MYKSIFAKLLMVALFGFIVSSAKADQNLSEVKIKTSAHCSMCKTKIEKALLKTKGVKQSDVNLDDKMVTVKYNPDKTNPDNIRQSIAKLGFDADDVKAGSGCCTDKAKAAGGKCCNMKGEKSSDTKESMK